MKTNACCILLEGRYRNENNNSQPIINPGSRGGGSDRGDEFQKPSILGPIIRATKSSSSIPLNSSRETAAVPRNTLPHQHRNHRAAFGYTHVPTNI